MSEKVKDTVKQNADKSWSFMHPTTGEWTEKFAKRDDARRARTVIVLRNKAANDAAKKSKKSTSTEETAAPVVEQKNEEQKNTEPVEKDVDSGRPVHVESIMSTSTTTADAASVNNNNQGDVAQQEKSIMSAITLTLDPKTRKSTSLVFKLPAGLRGSVRIAKTAFPGGVAPETLALQSESENAFAQSRAKMTAEERKEARKNAPKLTPEQKLQKLTERAAKLQAKIAASQSAPVEATA